MHTRSDGIGFGGDLENPAELLTWGQVKQLAQDITDELRDEIRDLRTRWNRHQRAFPRFTASAAAAGCGPFPCVGPLSERQIRYAEELAEWESSGLEEAWAVERSVIEAKRERLHDLAFPLAVCSEPVDLLELLDEVSGEQRLRPAKAAPDVAALPAFEHERRQARRCADRGMPL